MQNTCGVVGKIEDLFQNQHLSDVRLHGCPYISGDLSSVGRLENLKVFHLNNMNCSGTVEGFAKCANLISLNLRDCPNLTGSLRSLVDCSNLATVEVYNCPGIITSEEDLQALAKNRKVYIDGRFIK
jgi:hypothetical protein